MTSSQETVVQDSEKTPARAWVILIVTYVASFMAPACQMKVAPLATDLMAAFSMDAVTYGYLMSAMTIMGVILAFPAAWICRGIGLKKTMLISVGCLAVGSAMGALVNDVALLMVSRAIEGVGIGLIGVVAPTCVSIWFPAKTRGFALGLWATWFPIGVLLVLNIAPSIALSSGWRTVFWICAILSAAAFVLFALVFKMPEGMSDADASGLDSEGGMLDAFKYLKNKQIWFLGIAFFVLNYIMQAIINTYYPLFLQTGLGLDSVASGSLTSVQNILSIVAIPIVGAILGFFTVDKKRYLAAGIMVLMLVGSFFAFKTGDNGVMYAWVYICIAGAASGGIAGVLRPMVPDIMSGMTAIAMGMAVLQVMQNLASALGAPLFGTLATAIGWDTANLVLNVPIIIIGIIFVLLVNPLKVKKD